jgi:type 1 glutamine amidotransferase/sugar phosphate isomerase/epimerase
MTKAIGLVTVFFVGGAIALAQVPGPARGATGAARGGTGAGRGGAQSVRPADSRRIRTSVNSLLGWRVGIPADVFRALPFSDSAAMADALGFGSIEGYSTQQVSAQIQKNLDYNLSPAETAVAKARLADLRLRMPAYHVESIPADENARRTLFAFAKDLGVETIVTGAVPDSLAALDQMAGQTGVNVAIEAHGDPKTVMSAIAGTSPHIGVCADFGSWIEQGIRPDEGLAALKDRLMVAHVRDRSELGRNGRDVPLGTGVSDLEKVLLEIAKQEPPPQEQPDKCSNCSRPYGGTKPLFIALDVNRFEGMDPSQVTWPGEVFSTLWRDAEGFEQAARPAMGYRVEQDARLIPITSTDRIPADVKQKIDGALPRQALATPKKPRKLLVVDLCPAGAYYHDTAAHANLAIREMAEYTGAFQAVFSNDLSNLKYPNILQFDAVFLNSGDGDVFADPEVLNGLMRFVREGGGVAGLHGASYASMNVPEFGDLIGAQDGAHHTETATLKIDDPNSPLTRQFASSPLTADFGGKGFVYTDEFYHFLPTGPYSREKLHVLISIDAPKSDMSNWHVRPDNDYGLVWVKSYGAGRVFNCAMGHTPTLFSTPALAQMMLGAIQFVLGDLPMDTTPSALLATK